MKPSIPNSGHHAIVRRQLELDKQIDDLTRRVRSCEEELKNYRAHLMILTREQTELTKTLEVLDTVVVIQPWKPEV